MTPIDDGAARELLAPLAGEPGGTQRLDVDHIVREGDRRRRTRTIGTGALTAVFLMTLAAGTTAILVNGRQSDGVPADYGSAPASDAPYLPSVPTGPDCALSALPGATGLLAAVDHTGHYTLQEVSDGNKTTAVIRKDGVKVAEVEIPGGRDGGEYEINAKGEFTAIIADGSGSRPVAFSYAYTAGKLTKLKADSVAIGIADDGRIAGEVKQAPAIWERPGTPPKELKVPRGKQAQVMSVDQDGTVLGYADTEASQFANLWLPDGSSRAIPVAEGQSFLNLGGIANGWVVGFNNLHGFRYHIAAKKYEVLPAQVSRPHTVANNGAVVGDDGTDGNLYVLDGGAVRKLPVRPQMRAYAILAISDDGRTVMGNEYDPSPVGDPGRKTGRAVTWACS